MKGELAQASFEALGTTAAVACEPDQIDAAVAEVRAEIDAIDRTCSRFRDDSDLSRVNASAGEWTAVDPLLIDAVEVAVQAARVTDGAVDPTIGRAMIRLGYDRDFRSVAAEGPALTMPVLAVSSRWRDVEIRRASSKIRIPADVALDLGATGKAFTADRGATRAAATTGGGVLVGLGGDISVAGPARANGWSIGIAEDHAARPERGETISITTGGVATSTTTIRAWRRGGVRIHHVVDPRTGLPACAAWRTVSVCANTCVDANTASTAAIVLGGAAVDWLARQRLPARLVRNDGSVVRLGGWPERCSS